MWDCSGEDKHENVWSQRGWVEERSNVMARGDCVAEPGCFQMSSTA